ncbi:hypothetical protein NFI96_007619 [Prochilodus magdalenae]|nr:hypothetical protein NFI96_007619 [Prochilodus magdalenae]
MAEHIGTGEPHECVERVRKEEKVRPDLQTEKIPGARDLYTDGCCYRHDREGLIAAYPVVEQTTDGLTTLRAERLSGQQSAQRAEVLAVIAALQEGKDFLPRSLIMATPDNRALQHLAAELARLDRQIAALLKKLPGVFPARRPPLQRLRRSRPRCLHHPDFNTRQDTPSSPRPHKEFGDASTAEGLPDRLLPDRLTPAILCPRQPILRTQPAAYSNTSFSASVAHSSTSGLLTGPCARVLDIARRLPTALSNCNAFGTVVIHVGTNDICARQSEVLKEHYQTLLDTARKSTNARIVISGPLPTYRKGCERFSRLFGLQSWLRGWCAVNGLGFVDNWSSFWEQPALYRRDGLHPSRLVYSHGTSRGPSADCELEAINMILKVQYIKIAEASFEYFISQKLIKETLLSKPGGTVVLKEYEDTGTICDSSRRQMVNILVAHMTETEGYFRISAFSLALILDYCS